MGEDQHPNKSPVKNPKPAAAQPEGGNAFDVWLQRSLHQLYDGVTQEPIPPELLRLIEEDRARRKR
jgi:hypothetical protein